MSAINRSPEFRLIDFKVKNAIIAGKKGSSKEFIIQMFGINEKGKSASITVKGFEPFFFVKVGPDWDIGTVKSFERELYNKLAYAELDANYRSWESGKRKALIPPPLDGETRSLYAQRNAKSYQSYHQKGVVSFTMVQRHQLYGFDNNKLYNFVCITFKNTTCFNKIKAFWQNKIKDGTSLFGFRNTLKNYVYHGFATQLYEAALPPLLRFFHISNISPSGWIRLPSNKWKAIKSKKTLCDFECTIKAIDIHPLPNKETATPMKICSFDIEASSSHGDFPVAKKTYKKLAGELQMFWTENVAEIEKLMRSEQLNILRNQILSVYGLAEVESNSISRVFTKEEVTREDIEDVFDTIASIGIKTMVGTDRVSAEQRQEDSHDDDELYSMRKTWNTYIKNKNKKGATYTLLDCLLDNIDVGKKVDIMDQ